MTQTKWPPAKPERFRFTDEPVPREVLQRVLSAAAWSPSGSNLQPWNTYVLTGALLAELKTRAVERVAHGDPWDEREYEMYPRGPCHVADEGTR